MPHLPRSAYAIVGLSLALIAACLHIRSLQATIAAKPTTQDRVVTKTVQGPTRTEIRTIVKPGGERVEERIVYVESKTTERENEHSEKPAANRRSRYVGLGIDPLDYHRPTVRAGLNLWDTYDIGGTLDTRNMRPGVELAFRF